MEKLKIFFPLLCSLIFLIYIGNSINISEQIFFYEELNKIFYFYFAILFLPIHFFISLKYKILIENYKKINLLKSIYVNLIGFTFSLLIPMKGGDFFRQKYIDFNKKEKQPNSSFFFKINFLEKVISLFAIVLIISIFSFFSTEVEKVFPFYKFLKYFFLLLVLFFLYFFYFQVKKKFSISFSKILFFDLITWLLQFFQIFLIVFFFDINLSIVNTIIIFGLAIVFGSLPISLGGFGIRDYILFHSFNLMGISENLLVVLVFFNLRYLIPAFITFLVLTYKYFLNDN